LVYRKNKRKKIGGKFSPRPNPRGKYSSSPTSFFTLARVGTTVPSSTRIDEEEEETESKNNLSSPARRSWRSSIYSERNEDLTTNREFFMIIGLRRVGFSKIVLMSHIL
jgi:hypothetical protein